MSIKRIDTIDILRGFFIFMIIVDHLEMFPSGYDIFTGRGQLWMSAAEGFFFLSGIMVGLLRGRKMIDLPFINTVKKLFSRSIILYFWAIGLTILFTLISLKYSGTFYIKPGVWVGSLSDMLTNTITMQYIYSWADFLKFYSVYLLLSIPAIYLLRKNLAWILGLLTVSFWLYGGSSEYYNWQFLFFGGVIAGWYWTEILEYCKNIPKFIKIVHYPLTIITLIASVLIVEGSFFPGISNSLEPYFLRSNMYLPRILIFILWFSAMYRFINHYENIIKNSVGKLLIPYGQNSLYAYILQGFLVYFSQFFIPKGQPIYINFAFTTFSLFIIWLAIKKQFLFKIIPR